jgi:hypothetical protein
VTAGRLVAGVALYVLGVVLLYPLFVILGGPNPLLSTEIYGVQWGASILGVLGIAAIAAGFVVLWARRR